jgi:RNA polymerase sigma-70 factor (ECF subfamily)
MISDEELFRLWQQANADALEALVQRYHRVLLAYLYRLVGQVETAEDLVQETFVSLVREAQSYCYPRPFAPWLYTIAHNLARNHRTSAYHRHVHVGKPVPERLTSDTDPSALVERWDWHDDLRKALVLLTFEQREVLSLRFGQEMSVHEVAKLLGIPAGTVKSRTFQALRILRRYLQSDPHQSLVAGEKEVL